MPIATYPIRLLLVSGKRYSREMQLRRYSDSSDFTALHHLQHITYDLSSEPMDDFSNIINLLESAKQLASMNSMPVLAYLIDVAKCEARENKPVLRKRKRGESTIKQEQET